MKQNTDDLISREDAINALWKALYEYEDKTEKQFQESDELDVGDWILHRIFVQNMSDIDRQTILDLPSAQTEIIRCEDCKFAHITYGGEVKYCDVWFPDESYYIGTDNYCSFAKRREDDHTG